MEHSESLPRILTLESIGENEGPLVGPKALGIARLMKLGLPVPGGFCVTTGAYREHLEKCRVTGLIDELREGSNSGVLEGIRRRITEEPLASDFEARLREHFRRLAAPLCAVRSSATKEDLSGRSFAGLYETFIGIRDPDSCIESLKKCWASLWTGRVFHYLKDQEASSPPLMAVIIQKLVRAEYSGVMFSGANDDAALVIESCFGLGEALVSGKVTPDRFVVNKKSLAIVEQRLAEKPLMLEALPDGSVKERRLVPPGNRKASLDRSTLKKLCSLALRAGSLFSGPQDIEWAIEGGRIYLLQCRPVTAALNDGTPLHIFSNANLGEVLPDVVTPLTRSFVMKLMELPFLAIFRRLGIDLGEPRILAVIDGRFYYDITALMEIFDALPGNQADGIKKIMGGHQERLVGRLLGRVRKKGKKPGIHPLTFLVNYPPLLARMLTSSARHVDRILDRLHSLWRIVEKKAPDFLPAAEILELIHYVAGEMHRYIPEGAAAVMGGLPGFEGLRRICARWLGDSDGSLANRLMIASGSIESADPGIALSCLASVVRKNPGLEALVRSGEGFAALAEKLHELPGGDEFLKLWDEFMERHGHHARGEFEFYTPRWLESPDYVLSLVKDYAGLDEGNGASGEYCKRAGERARLTEECRARLKNPVKRKIFDFLLSRAQRGLALRERYKSETIRQIAFMRMLYLRLGRDFVSRGIVERDDDIFFLETGELEPVHEGQAAFEVKETVTRRRSEYERDCGLRPCPVIIDSGGEMRGLPYDTDDAELMTGIGVSSGRAMGPARVILPGAGDARVLPGEILVIPYADPGWAPYFFLSAGLVIDMGGMLSHASIIAREYGIPAVVNVGPASAVVRTGQIVEVDGSAGIVRILPEQQV